MVFLFPVKGLLLLGELNVFICTYDWKQMQRERQMGKTLVYTYITILVHKGSLEWKVALGFEDS